MLDSSPHVCNGCKQRRFCTLEKSLYKALDAQDEYEDLLHVARQGFNFSGEELLAIDELVSPLIRQGQSVGASLTGALLPVQAGFYCLGDLST